MNLLIALFVALYAFPAYSAVVFEDNFNDHSDWSSGQNAWPNTAAVSGDNGAADGSTACTTCPDGTAKYRGFYSASSAWDGYKGEDTVQIGSTNARGGSGKAATFWMEPIDSIHCDGGTYWCSDGELAVSLPTNYNEIYVRYFIKYDPSWVWRTTVDTGVNKMMRVSHLHEGHTVPVWRFGDDGDHFPVNFLDFEDNNAYGISALSFNMYPRFQSSYRYETVPAPTYLVNGDMERFYASGGTGYNGYKTFAEVLGDGDWHSIEMRLKGNSGVGVEDGEWQVWIDGTSIALRTNIAWADSDYKESCVNCINPPSGFVGWNWVSIGGNMNNRVYSASTQTEQYYAIDDLVISTTYIGPDYVIGGDTTAPPTAITTSDPQAITSNQATITGTCDGADTAGAKWRIGAAPDATNGTACTGTTSFSCDTSGFAVGANTLYVGCYDEVPNYSSDFITVNYSQVATSSFGGSASIH